MKVLVLGASGMLGNAMFRILNEKEEWEVVEKPFFRRGTGIGKGAASHKDLRRVNVLPDQILSMVLVVRRENVAHMIDQNAIALFLACAAAGLERGNPSVPG